MFLSLLQLFANGDIFFELFCIGVMMLDSIWTRWNIPYVRVMKLLVLAAVTAVCAKRTGAAASLIRWRDHHIRLTSPAFHAPFL